MKKQKLTMSDFFTAQKIEDGISIPIPLPCGSPSSHSMVIMGYDCKSLRVTEATIQREILKDLKNTKSDNKSTDIDPKEVEEETEKSKTRQARLAASLIKSWTFEEECNEVNKIKFLMNSSYIVDLIDKVSSNNKSFFTEPSSD